MGKGKEIYNQNWFYRSFFHKNNLKRDAIIVVISAVIIITGVFLLLTINHQKLFFKSSDKNLQSGEITGQAAQNEAENAILDTVNWNLYQTQWYGFELKYPENWNKPILKNSTAQNRWEYRYQFRKGEKNENNLYAGFDVVIYDVKKTRELSNTDEFPTIKDEGLKIQGKCQEISDHFGENENYSAEQVYIDFDDDCYNPAYFYTITRESYIYNIVPILVGEEEKVVQTEKEVIENLPEFISAASTFNLLDIKRPQAVFAKPRISAPKPIATTKTNAQGRMVCAKKNDHPSKSKTNKKKHLDMECCLDPDEYPNPHCYYDPKIYGKYL